MKTKLQKSMGLIVGIVLLLLSGTVARAQTKDPLVYNWQWALNGGGFLGKEGWSYRVEQIYDIAIDSQNNYYFLARIANGNPQLAGVPVTVYGNHMQGDDVFIFSTTCEGTVRWSQAIGGGSMFDKAFKIALDSKDNVYVGVWVDTALPGFPVHFSPTDIVPPFIPYYFEGYEYIYQEGYKSTYIAKYNKNGVFQWKKALQGDVNGYNFDSKVYNIFIDSKDVIHFIVAFVEGIHLDGLATVSGKEKLDYFLVQLNSKTQEFEKVMQLPIEGFLIDSSMQFTLDEKLNRYYISGFRTTIMFGQDNHPLGYQGSAFTDHTFILALDASTGAELWRRQIDPGWSIDGSRIHDLDIDTNGDLYIGGSLARANNAVVKIYDPKNPTANPFFFKFNNEYIMGNLPFIAKLHSDGIVQWARVPTGYTWDTGATGGYRAFKVAINKNEVALATNGSYTIWDDFSIDRPLNHKPDPLLVRFNKETGIVVGMHDILSIPDDQYMTAVEVDNDGNYVVGGSMYGSIFLGYETDVDLLFSNGHFDFFAAKLAAGACGENLSTERFSSGNLQIYPNPTDGIVHINTDEIVESYTIHNLMGQQVQKGLFAGETQIDLQNLTSGIYFITMVTLERSITLKVIKK